ncbi:MAG: hypothetical protein ABJA60_06475 [Nitrosospira sp.]
MHEFPCHRFFRRIPAKNGVRFTYAVKEVNLTPFLSKVAPTAELDLLFSPKAVEDLTKSENQAIKTYKPLLNTGQATTPNARHGLQNAFEQFYSSSFQSFLRGDAS